MDTPPFLIWSLEYTCQVRGFETGRDPERIERLLRAARAAADALNEGRVLDGVCILPPYGFRLDDALAIYGGQMTLDAACHDCPANARSRRLPNTWAGCFGMVPLPVSPEELERRLARLPSDLKSTFYPPVWPQLWMPSPIDPPRAQTLARMLELGQFHELGVEFEELRLALQTAAQEQIWLHVAAFPPGRADQGWWRLAQHCPRCKSVWDTAAMRRCHTCHYEGPPAPDKKRRVRGRRPYVLLERLLGARAAHELLMKYEASPAQPERPAPPQDPLQPVLPSSPPGG